MLIPVLYNFVNKILYFNSSPFSCIIIICFSSRTTFNMTIWVKVMDNLVKTVANPNMDGGGYTVDFGVNIFSYYMVTVVSLLVAVLLTMEQYLGRSTGQWLSVNKYLPVFKRNICLHQTINPFFF